MQLLEKSLKLDIVEIECEHSPPTTIEFSIDLEDYVLAVMECINMNKENTKILKDGRRRPM